LPVIAAGDNVLADRLDLFVAKLPACIGILLIIPAAESRGRQEAQAIGVFLQEMIDS